MKTKLISALFCSTFLLGTTFASTAHNPSATTNDTNWVWLKGHNIASTVHIKNVCNIDPSNIFVNFEANGNLLYVPINDYGIVPTYDKTGPCSGDLVLKGNLTSIPAYSNGAIVDKAGIVIGGKNGQLGNPYKYQMKDGPREHYDGVAYYTLYPNAPYGTDMQPNDLVIHFTAGVAK